jgi:5,10-methylenetetrahydromethanopterin reductase
MADSSRPTIGMAFDRNLPPALILDFARRLDEAGADRLWVIEDCFRTAGISLAAAALAVTDRLQVGIGILPSLARNPAIMAMEFATLARLAPGRFLPGIGHGVQSWMGQIGVRPASPLTAFDEVVTSVKRLIAGEEVTVDGRYVHLDKVKLDYPPDVVPPVLGGVQGPKSLQLVGRVADGVILVDPGTPSYVKAALELVGRPTGPEDAFDVTVFGPICLRADRHEARAIMTPWLASMIEGNGFALSALPFVDDLKTAYTDGGAEALAGLPDDWWLELAPVGTRDDIEQHLDALGRAGATNLAFFTAENASTAVGQLDDVVELVAAWKN